MACVRFAATPTSSSLSSSSAGASLSAGARAVGRCVGPRRSAVAHAKRHAPPPTCLRPRRWRGRGGVVEGGVGGPWAVVRRKVPSNEAFRCRWLPLPLVGHAVGGCGVGGGSHDHGASVVEVVEV